MSDITQSIDALLTRAVASGDVPGAVAMATDRDGLLYEGAFGERVLGRARPMTLDTVVWIASMTKAITGAAAMQLVEQGKLDLDSPASSWVPELESVQVLEGFDASGAPRTRAPKRPITLRHLLTHTAGYGYPVWSRRWSDTMRCRACPAPKLRERRVARAAAVRSRRALELWHQHRLGRQGDRSGQRQEARRLSSGKSVRAARHDAIPRSRSRRRCARAWRKSMSAVTTARSADRLRSPAGAGVRNGRRRALLDRARLLEIRAHDPRSRHEAARARCSNETVELMSRNHIGELLSHQAENRHAGAVQRRGVLPGNRRAGA